MSDFNESVQKAINILPLKNLVIYPYQVYPLNLESESAISLVNGSMDSKIIGGILKIDPNLDDAGSENLYKFGTALKILKLIKLPDNTARILIQGISRMKVIKYIQTEPFFKAEVKKFDETIKKSIKLSAHIRNVRSSFQKYLNYIPQLGEELKIILMNINEPGKLADLVAANLNISIKEKQGILELIDIEKRLSVVSKYLNRELQVLELSSKLQNDIKTDIDKKQKEYLLRQQLIAIKRELGEDSEIETETNELKEKIENAGMPDNVKDVAMKELSRMSRMQPGFAEYNVSRTYLDWLIELPWTKSTKDKLDIKKARINLNKDHYNLEKVKERILEYLAVRKLKPDIKGPILCFVGPPGVGKTSLGRSIAKTLQRKFIRMSLGGIRDEAEIRGHRRTYVGSLPGRIIQGIKNAGSNNPVFMLDEIDKVGNDFRGDPASALLEVLDPEQNFSFNDHYLDLSFDLAKVMFITTANVLDTIPKPLLDRMEVLRIPGYTLEEKVSIAQKFLIPKQTRENGLKTSDISFRIDGIKKIIESYTREAGLRNLEREIATICRKIAKKFAETGKKQKNIINSANVIKLLGPERFIPDVAQRMNQPGVSTGLAWTQFGGTILFIEATIMKGSNRIILTGQLGDVMKESATIALSLIKANCKKYKIDEKLFEKADIHIHVPEGAVPKDGPSAGVSITSALFSLFSNKRIKSDVAMTGEITLQGKILPVGGIKEKILAAKQAGIKTVILPKQNKKDVLEISPKNRKSINFKYVETIDTVFKYAIDK